MTAAPAPTDSHCPYCALQCAMTLTRVDADATIRSLIAERAAQ